MHRQLLICEGDRAQTAREALHLIACLGLDPERLIWLSDGDGPPATPSVESRRLLGRSAEIVVLDGHGGLDPDVLGRCQGLVLGGGALILRVDAGGPALDRPLRDQMQIEPWPLEAIGDRFQRRAWAKLQGARHRGELTARAIHQPTTTEDQRQLVTRLSAIFQGPGPSASVIIADRGRGKSSALGLTLSALPSSLRIAVTATERRAADEIFRFAGPGRAHFVPLYDLLDGPPGSQRDDPTQWDVVIVDEAAAVGVPVLQRLVERHRRSHLAFATTVDGYEGSGRGFTLRFVEWLRRRDLLTADLRLSAPVRWSSGDPVEAAVHDALLLDAALAPAEALQGSPRHVAFDRDALVADERRLRDFIGVLVHAHYRTSPGDVMRALDAPNIRLHGLVMGDRVVGASLVALEGELSSEQIEDLYWGRQSLRGHALPEVLIGRGGWRAAGAMRLVRSVRIAVHPALRRRGLGALLAAGVHESYQPDMFGTLFGVTTDLLAFRRAQGYRLVQLGVAAGPSTGVPSAVMVKPMTPEAEIWVDRMTAALARDLPTQLDLMTAGDHVILAPDLRAAALAGTSTPAPLPQEVRDDIVATVVQGRRPFEAGAVAIRAFVEAHSDHLKALNPAQQAMIKARVLDGRGWPECAQMAGASSLRVAMRALRRALSTFYDTVRDSLS